jgi:hypothetical protein
MAEPNAEAVVATRQFWVWTKAYDAANDLPADTVVYGADISGYAKRGYTSGGLGMNWNIQRGTINVDQELDPILRPIQSRNLTLDSNLAEFTPDNLVLATGTGDVDTNDLDPVSGTRGHRQVDINSDVVETFYTVIYDIEQQNLEALRIAVWRGLPTGSPSPRIEPNNLAAIAFQVTALPDTSTSPARLAAVRLVVPALP